MNRRGVALILVVAAVACIATLIALSIGGFFFYRQITQTQPQSDEEAIRLEFARMVSDSNKKLETTGGRSAIASIEIEGDWALVSVGLQRIDTGEFVDAGPGLMIFRKTNGSWSGVQLGTEKFKLWVEDLPSSLLSPESKEWFR